MKFVKFNSASRAGFVFAAAALAASATFAGGTHGGGHDESPIGEAGVAANVTRTIEVDAADSMRFTPSNVSVKKGETIRFVIKNSGKVPHEFSLGTEKELKEHYEVMKKNPEMEHADENMVTVAPEMLKSLNAFNLLNTVPEGLLRIYSLKRSGNELRKKVSFQFLRQILCKP